MGEIFLVAGETLRVVPPTVCGETAFEGSAIGLEVCTLIEECPKEKGWLFDLAGVVMKMCFCPGGSELLKDFDGCSLPHSCCRTSF